MLQRNHHEKASQISTRTSLSINLRLFWGNPSLLACVLYEYHAQVVIYRPFDPSNTIALYMAMLSVVFWIAYLITRFVKKSR